MNSHEETFVSGYRPFSSEYTRGSHPHDFTLVGPELQPIHDSQQAPTGLAVDSHHNVYLAYPRNGLNGNGASSPDNVVICTDFNTEKPWPSAEMQNCKAGQDPATCFINVQNVVLDSIGQLWVVDSGISPGSSQPLYGGAKLMSFNESTGALLRTYVIPKSLLTHGMNMNDLRINNTLGPGGFAFMTEISGPCSLIALNLHDGTGVRRLFNTSVVRADEKYVGSYDGQLIYNWNGTKKGYSTVGADGIALASGNLYWGVLASRRFYYISQEVLASFNATDDEVLAAVQFPGQVASEQAGFTADDRGRVYMLASEHNAIYYVDTLQSEVNETVNGILPGGSGLIPADNYVVKTLVRSAEIQHADSAAILDGWLYFCTNQLQYHPSRQYKNIDGRRGPFRSFRVWIGRGPAI
ncbi:hypothetical protein GQ53DRAFT_875925 [Thozetella sp. PMI_491]|nr:hypothetical protein GQ53DRAFT_875925 [Thozetella sp. PMI_491]